MTKALLSGVEALRIIASIISDYGCDCECEHHFEEHITEGDDTGEEPCERCIPCKVGNVLARTLF